MSSSPLDALFLQSEGETPLVLHVALQLSKLCFPDLIYAGKIVSESEHIDDCELCLFARDMKGEPRPENAISLEIVKVGAQRSITAEYPEQDTCPILWYGQHAVWMDGESGKTVGCPTNGLGLERFARGVLKRLDALDDQPING